MLDVSKAIDLESLKLLESKVEQFVAQHERVREEHGVLARRLVEKDRELAEAAVTLKRYEQERAEIRARLERILSRLDALDLT
ncbi:MAG TPA: cell division protein ZapB [Candidatus Margulisiibacteriota bacterium]|nr:cell division protein ZapB [Candidatus Margulisiibacteriota bacterium]